MAILRTIARHGMTKGAAFFYAVAVGAAANFVIDYVHHRDDAIPIVAHDTVTAPEHERAATAPITRPDPRTAEPRVVEPRVPERPTTASLPRLPEVKPLPAPAGPTALPQVPTLPLPNPSAATTLPPSSDLPTPPLKPASMPSLAAPPATASVEPQADRPIFNVPLAVPAAPAAASALPPADKPADRPVEAMSIPTPPPGPSIGNPVSLLPPPDKPADPPPPKIVKPGSGTGGLY